MGPSDEDIWNNVSRKRRRGIFFSSHLRKNTYTHPLRSSFSFTGVQSRAARQEKRGPKGEGERGKGEGGNNGAHHSSRVSTLVSCLVNSHRIITAVQEGKSLENQSVSVLTFFLSLMEPFPLTMILQPVSCSSCLVVMPRGPRMRPTKLN